jgi:8-oxo-dGTP pyrophosphatase MutT (NUDIX family)
MYISNKEKVLFVVDTVFVIRSKPLFGSLNLEQFEKNMISGTVVRDNTVVLSKYLKALTLGKKRCEANFVYLSVHSIERFFEELSSVFKVVKAGGGVVMSEKGMLLIKRLGKWDLPKGKLEKGESIEQCACREVEEECNVKVELEEFRVKSYHTYEVKGKAIIKETYWYNMSSETERELVPQQEEGIEEVVWADSDQQSKALNNTYSSIAWVLNKLEV